MAGLQWAIQGEEKKKFETIFDSLHPVNGKLGGDRVKPIFLNSKLSNEILGKVWELSDIDKDGQLDKDEFCVAMHLVYKALEQKPVPSILTQDLIPPSKRKPILAGAVAVLPPISLIPTPPKSTTNSDILISTSSPTLQPQRPSTSSNLHIKGYVPDIEIQRFSAIFNQKVDPEGHIHGADARGVFVQSQLPQNILAHVWNLCDQNQLGKLNRDQFILAMHFIAQKVKGVEVPTQLPQEVLAKSRDSGIGDAGNLSDSSSSGIGDFSAVKELDALNREIEELRLEKDTLSREIEEKKRIVQNKSNEVQELQNTLDRASTSLSQLESDKSEAHTRLDDLDQQQLKLDHMIAHVRSKIEEETRAVMTLQSQIKAQELANKRQEEEHSKAKSELENLKKEESQLQQTLQIGEQQLQNITKQVTDTENEIGKVKEKIGLLGEKRKYVSSNIEQYDKAVVALKNEKEVTDSLISKMEAEAEPLPRVTEVSPNPDSFFSDNGIAKTGTTFDAFETSANRSLTGTPFEDKGKKNDDDMFATSNDFFSTEPTFKSENDADPFSGSDPFTSSASPVSWGNKTTGSQNSNEKFSVTFDDSNSSSLFNEADNVNAKTIQPSDPWAAFGSGSNSSAAQNDPFGGDMFASSATGNTGFDQAFGSSFTSQSSNVTNNSGGGFGSNSFEDEEKKRKENLKLQEQQDYELALKLSKEV